MRNYKYYEIYCEDKNETIYPTMNDVSNGINCSILVKTKNKRFKNFYDFNCEKDREIIKNVSNRLKSRIPNNYMICWITQTTRKEITNGWGEKLNELAII